MAYKVIDLPTQSQPSGDQGYKVIDLPTQSNPQTSSLEENPESWGDSLVRNLVTGTERLAEGTLGLPGNLEQLSHNLQHLLNQKVVYPLRKAVIPEEVQKILGFEEKQAPDKAILPTGEDIRSFVGKALPKNYLESKGTSEEILHNVIESAPLALLLGGSASTLQKLGNLTAGQTGMKLAEKAGFGVGGQILGSIVGNKSFDKLVNYANMGGTAKGLDKLAKDAYTQGYKVADEIGKDLKIRPSKDTIKELYNISDEFKSATGLTEAEKSAAKNIDGLIKKMEFPIDLKSLSEEEKALTKLYGKVKDHTAKSYISRAKNLVTENLKEAGTQHPEWGKNYFTAKDIYSASKFQPALKQAFKNNRFLQKSIKNPLTGALLGLGAYGSGTLGYVINHPVKVIGGAAASYAGKKSFDSVKNFYAFMQTPERRKLLKLASKQLFEDNIPALAKTLSKIDSFADEFTKA